jgi:hypothetical protein
VTRFPVIPSFLVAALEGSTLGVRVVCRSENCIGINRCPFTHAHDGVPNVGAVIVMDPEMQREEYLWCRRCGQRPAHDVLRLLTRQTVLLAFLGWLVELNDPGVSSSGEEEPLAGA